MLQTKAIIYYGFPFFNEDHTYDHDSENYNHLHRLVDEDSSIHPKDGTKDGEVALGMSGDFGADADENIWHYAYIIGTLKWASLDVTTEIKPQHMVVEYDDWRPRLKKFCEAHGIPWQEPGWKLTAERS